MSKIFTIKDLVDSDEDHNENETKSSQKFFGDKDQDYMLAMQLQMQLDADDLEFDAKKSNANVSVVRKSPNKSCQSIVSDSLSNPEWDLIDPCPDIRAMFQEFDKKYFWNSLGSCIVEWSKRMV